MADVPQMLFQTRARYTGERCYDVSSDGKTYTFHLRQGAKWSDGQPVTAKDFVYSFKRILDPATAADYASFLTDSGIVGAADFNSKKGTADQVGVRAVDDNTLEIQLEAPIGYFPNIVAWIERIRAQPRFLAEQFPYSIDPHSADELP